MKNKLLLIIIFNISSIEVLTNIYALKFRTNLYFIICSVLSIPVGSFIGNAIRAKEITCKNPACTNDNVLKLFNRIKEDLEIKETIVLLVHSDSSVPSSYHSLTYPFYYISLNEKTINSTDTPKLIHHLAHELAHHLEFTKNPITHNALDRYNLLKLFCPKKQKEDCNRKKEFQADTTATEYLRCQYCLKRVQKSLGHKTNSKHHNDGYFSQQDYQPYIDRAVKNNWTCPAHEHEYNDPNNKIKLTDTALDFLPKTKYTPK